MGFSPTRKREEPKVGPETTGQRSRLRVRSLRVSGPMSPLAAFHSAVQRWFAERLGEPTAPQREGWPLIREGRNVLIAAPTGSGKTLAAFLSAIDSLLQKGSDLTDETSALYVSPLRALSNDVQK